MAFTSALKRLLLRIGVVVLFLVLFHYRKRKPGSAKKTYPISRAEWREKIRNLTLVDVNEERIKLGLSSLELQSLNCPVKCTFHQLEEIIISIICSFRNVTIRSFTTAATPTPTTEAAPSRLLRTFSTRRVEKSLLSARSGASMSPSRRA